MNQDLSGSCTEAQTAEASLTSTEVNKNWDQTDSPGKDNQGAKISQNLKTGHGHDTVQEIPVSQNGNRCEDKLTDSKDVDNLEMSNRSDGTEDENSTNKTDDQISENLHKQNDFEETTGLLKLNSDKDNTMAVSKEEQKSSKDLNSPMYQPSASNSGKESVGKIFSDKSEELLRHKTPMPVCKTGQIFYSDQKESDKKVENAIAVGKQDALQTPAVSPDCQTEWGNAEVPGIFPPNSQVSNINNSPDNWKPVPPLRSTPDNSNKDCQVSNDSEITKDQTKRLNNPKTNTFTPTTQPETRVGHGNSDSTENSLTVLERTTDANLKASKQCPEVNPSQESNTETLSTKSSLPLSVQLTADCSTNSQHSHMGQSPIPGQTLPETNRTLQPNIQRQGAASTLPQIGTTSYFDSSGQASSQNKFGNEIKSTNSVNLYNKNQNKMSNNQGRLNAHDACSKLVPNNLKAPTLIRPRIQNLPQQPNQPVAQPIRLSTLPNNDKETSESELRFSFPTTTGMNPGFSYNQRPCYTGYDASSVPYVVYSDNSNIRRNGLCNRSSPAGNIANNNPLSIQRPGIYSVQPFHQNITRLGSPYFLMWPSPGDQTIGSNKLTMTQPSSTPGINSSYQQTLKNYLPNPIKDNNSYSTSAPTNDTKRCKNQFSDGSHNLLARQQNPVERSNSAISHDGINKQQGNPQSIQGTYNTNSQPIPPQQNEMFMNRGNDNSFTVNQNSMQRGQSSGYLNYQSMVGQNGRLPNSSQSDQQFFAQSQNLGSHLQRSSYDQYQEPLHYYPGISMPNANSYSLPGAIPPPKTQNITNSNLNTGYAQHPSSSISSTQNSEIPTLQGQTMTNTTVTTSTTSSSSTKEVPKKTDTSIREKSLLDTGQHQDPQGFQKKIPELGIAHRDDVFTKYPTQASMANSSQLGPRFSVPDTNTTRPNYNKDAHANKGHTFYSPSNSDSILTWSQYYPQNFDLTRPFHPSQRGYMNYDPPHGDRNLTQFNFQLQNNIHSHFYASQSYNNYMQQIHQSFDTLQGTQRPQNSFSTGNNVVASYNSTATGQNFESFRGEDQSGVAGEKFPVFPEIPTNMASDQVTWKAEGQDKKLGFSIQTETSDPKQSGGEQFQNYNFASNLCPKAPERGTDMGKFTQISTPTTAAGTSTKSGDLLTRALSNPNFGMTSEESFLFSDFDPLFTSSLLTNDLDYFPENNSAFDQCFEDAASIAMATVTQNEARIQQSLDPGDPSQVPISQQQQQQLTSLLNIPSDTSTGSSAQNISLPQIHYNQVPSSRTAMDSNQIKNHYTSCVGNFKNLVPLTNKPNESILGYIPGADISTLSSKIGLRDNARPSDLYPDESIVKRFSDLCTSKTASQLAKPISDYKSGKKWVNKRGTNSESDENGIGIKKRNRQKKENSSTSHLPGEESVKKLKKKITVPKGPPRPRGRPPKNKSLGSTSSVPTQPVGPGLSINDANKTNQIESLNIGPEASEKNLPKLMNDFPVHLPVNEQNLESRLNINNSSPLFPVSRNSSIEPEFRKDLVSKNPAQSNRSDDKISSNESSVSEEPAGNPCSTTETQRELSDREVIDAVTKCLESISRNEETDNSDQMKECHLDAYSQNADTSLDSSVSAATDLQSGAEEEISREDQALSKEEKLMKAYTELKKKLEERMNRSLWRQSYLKRNETKNDKAFRKLSKKECMTAYSGTSSWGPDDDLFSRYSNRSSSNNGSKLVTTADSTSTNIDSKPEERTEDSNPEVIDIELVRNLDSVEKQMSDTNDQLISSTEVSEPTDTTSKISTTLRLPSMMEVVRIRLTDDLSSTDKCQPKQLASESSKEQAESPVQIESVPGDYSESIEKYQDPKENNDSNETEQIENHGNGNAIDQQPKKPPPAPRHPVLQPYSPSPLLPPPPPPPLPTQVIHFLPNKDKKVTPRKVGPTIVENAKICYEAIRKYLTKANTDFDSFLISYANIVQGLLNCGADRYGRIKAILLNKSYPELGGLITQEDNKTTEHIAVDNDDLSTEDSSGFRQDIDASDIQGEPGGGENTIDVDDFGSSYADIVKVILSSRADEYRNIKQALSKNICGSADICQGQTKSAGKSRCSQDVGSETSIPVPTVSDEVNGAALTKANRKPRKKTQDETLQNPAKVIKKRRKRKTQEEKGSASVISKVVFSDEAYATEASCKKAPKRKPKKMQYTVSTSKDRKRGSTKSPGFRIILSSNYFAGQSGKGSNSSVKSKKSGTTVEEDHEDSESRRSMSSDDGFVEESTGDYVMGLGSESGEEEKYSTIFKTEPLNIFDEQTFGNMDTTKITDKKAASWYEDVFKTEKDAPPSNLNFKREDDRKDSFLSGDPKTTIEGFNLKDEASTLNMGKHEEKKRQRPSRRAASAGVGAIRCPCGCSSNGSSLKDDSVENQLRDLTMSFKNRNRSKIIKPKSASIPKKRGRPRKIDKCPQKIISKLWTDISASGEEKSHDNAKALSNWEEPLSRDIPGKLAETFSVTNMTSKLPSAFNDTISDLAGRREISKFDSDSDSEDLRDLDIFMRSSTDSNDSWKSKKSDKKGKLRTLKKKKRNSVKYDLYHSNTEAPIISVRDSPLDGTDKKLVEEQPTKKDESASEEDESWAKNNPLNSNAASKSMTGTEWTNESTLDEYSRDGDISKTRISFKDFIPNVKSPPLPKTLNRCQETPKETRTENINLPDSTETIEEINKTFVQNDSDNKKELLESLKPLDGEQNLIVPDTGDALLSDNDAIFNDEMKMKVNDQRPQNDTSQQPKSDDSGNLADVSKEGYSESIETKSGHDTSKIPEEISSSEDRLRSLIEKITEINAATKRHTKRSTSVEIGSENIEKDSQPLDADYGPKDDEGMRVKTELVERIDETIRCPIGLSDSDDSSSNSCSDSSSSRSQSREREKQKRRSMAQGQSLYGSLKIKMPSPLNPKKKKPDQTLKVQTVRFENKIIIRKTCLKKKIKTVRNRQKLKRNDKNIFDIISQNETEDEESGCLSYSLTGKSEISSKISSSDMNESDKIQRLNEAGKSTIYRTTKKAVKTNKAKLLDSHSNKSSLLLQTEGPGRLPGFLENAISSVSNSLEIPKKKKRKRAEANESLLTETKLLRESDDEGLNDGDSYSRELHKNVLSDTDITMDDSLGKEVGIADDSTTKRKKLAKKSKGDVDCFSSKDNEVCFPPDVQKRKRRKKSLEPQYNSTLSADIEKGSKEKLIVSGAMRRNRKTRMVESSSDQVCGTLSKPEDSLNAVDGSNTKRKRRRRPAADRPPLQCTYCPKVFKKPSELLYHTRSHTGVRPFACDKCDKSFVSNAHLLRHQRTHSSERKHVCPTCDRGFTQHYGMLVHQLIHSGLKPHKCPDCSKAFRTKGCVGTHRRKQHPEQVAKERRIELQKDPQDSK